MDLFYENQLGTIHFKGAGKREEGFFVTSIMGLGPVEKEAITLSYLNSPGQSMISIRERERVLMLTVDICSSKNLKALYRRLIEVLYKPGELRVLSGNMYRKIACRCTLFGEPERHGKHIMSVCLQLTCDLPHFTDIEEQQVTIFSRENKIQNTITLPCVFTKRTTGAVMVNQGYLPAEPVFFVHNTGLEHSDSNETDVYGILFKNHRTGQQLKLLCHTQAGEVITLDIPNRSIMSNLEGNLIDKLSAESYLSDFSLEPGENYIEIVNLNRGEDINVLMCYENHYIEAVM